MNHLVVVTTAEVTTMLPAVWNTGMNWAGPQPGREPMSQPLPDTESKMLLAYLNAQRKHVIGILEGLDEEALRRPVLPSG